MLYGRTQAAINLRHLQSTEYVKVLATIELSARQPEVCVYEVSIDNVCEPVASQ